MEEFITDLFMKCVYILQWIGGTPGSYGYGYYLANIIIFVVIEPVLIVLLFTLWRIERMKRNANTKNLNARIAELEWEVPGLKEEIKKL
jgi:uncharacterized membrane protein